jgi:hypothetical protein
MILFPYVPFNPSLDIGGRSGKLKTEDFSGMTRVLWLLLTLMVAILLFVIGYAGYFYGHQQGYYEGYKVGAVEGAGSGYTLRNPTYHELMGFLERDPTDGNEYQEDVYTCVDFVSDLNNNAEDAGLRAAYVYMEFPVDRAHSVAAFETVDRGLVFIEPQFDDEVVVVVGNRYSVDNGYEEPDYDDTIVRFTIAW